MKPFYVLLGTFGIAWLALWLAPVANAMMLAGCIAMCAMLLFTAIGHFAFTQGMVAMIPRVIPYKKVIVYITGVMEIALGIALLFSAIRTISGWLLILFLIVILPANIHAAHKSINYQTGEHNGPGLTYLWMRVPLQLLFIAWVYYFTIMH